jgi:hypothetical protein
VFMLSPLMSPILVKVSTATRDRLELVVRELLFNASSLHFGHGRFDATPARHELVSRNR